MSAKVILIGPPGSGKSTIGKILAKEMKLSLLDTDSEISRRSGKSISDIFLEEGEAHFQEGCEGCGNLGGFAGST